MLSSIPSVISLFFGLTTLLTLFLFYRVLAKSSSEHTQRRAIPVMLGLTAWLIVQAGLALLGVYSDSTNAFPPRLLVFGILPTLVFIGILFASAAGRRFIDTLPLREITWLNVVRIPVEFLLLALFLHKAVPVLLTFHGRNFDLFSGLTAPLIAYLAFSKLRNPRGLLLAWNILCLGLLLNVFVTAMLSAPFPFQRLSFDQPNIGILYFPINWLPVFIVPVVFFGHLVSIRKLINNKIR